ncbi:MAG: hypothetical protein Q7S92_03450 [Candidatus Diapherotrites archaeon]|nr:hypothetical protein [Candidatus Diapherotrites archaeon]
MNNKIMITLILGILLLGCTQPASNTDTSGNETTNGTGTQETNTGTSSTSSQTISAANLPSYAGEGLRYAVQAKPLAQLSSEEKNTREQELREMLARLKETVPSSILENCKSNGIMPELWKQTITAQEMESQAETENPFGFTSPISVYQDSVYDTGIHSTVDTESGLDGITKKVCESRRAGLGYSQETKAEAASRFKIGRNQCTISLRTKNSLNTFGFASDSSISIGEYESEQKAMARFEYAWVDRMKSAVTYPYVEPQLVYSNGILGFKSSHSFMGIKGKYIVAVDGKEINGTEEIVERKIRNRELDCLDYPEERMQLVSEVLDLANNPEKFRDYESFQTPIMKGNAGEKLSNRLIELTVNSFEYKDKLGAQGQIKPYLSMETEPYKFIVMDITLKNLDTKPADWFDSGWLPLREHEQSQSMYLTNNQPAFSQGWYDSACFTDQMEILTGAMDLSPLNSGEERTGKVVCEITKVPNGVNLIFDRKTIQVNLE